VLPVNTTFERNDIDVLGEYSSRAIVAMQKVIEPLFESRSDFDIFSDIADRLGFKDDYTEGRDEMAWVRYLYDAALQSAEKQNIAMSDFDTFWRDGYVSFDVPKEAEQFVRFADFRTNPALNPLGTPSGRFELYSKTIEGFGYADCPPHASWLEPAEWLGGADAEDYPFHLLSAHPKNRLHSQMDNTWIRRWEEVSDREPIWIHPDDAAALGIAAGDVVKVESKRGAFLAGAVLTDRVSRHVVLCHEGAWPDPEQPEPGATDKHGNINTTTLDKGTSSLAQGNIANTVLVRIAKAEGDLPNVTAFKRPAGA
jgi:trimethylamine-N-oxide reductase (cytochrome c)